MNSMFRKVLDRSAGAAIALLGSVAVSGTSVLEVLLTCTPGKGDTKQLVLRKLSAWNPAAMETLQLFAQYGLLKALVFDIAAEQNLSWGTSWKSQQAHIKDDTRMEIRTNAERELDSEPPLYFFDDESGAIFLLDQLHIQQDEDNGRFAYSDGPR